VEATASITQDGLPIAGGKVTFAQIGPSGESFIRHDDALRLLNSILDEEEITLWLAVDRLDEAFQGVPDLERPVLRALLRTYLDMLEFGRVKPKLFVRKDLFRRIITGGFVNLSHINARKIEIIWEEEDLDSLLHRRVIENQDFVRDSGLSIDSSADEVFYTIFPEQVDAGERKPTTWAWMMSRIEDGNHVKPPRNLIDLATKAREAQLRREDRDPGEFDPSVPLISPEAIKRGLIALSGQRVDDTLLAEAGEMAPLIQRFGGGKAEHTVETLSRVLGDEIESAKYLEDIGFLERVKDSYKIPMLYRAGLKITQGKAVAN
jgi:hypothetical protein